MPAVALSERLHHHGLRGRCKCRPASDTDSGPVTASPLVTICVPTFRGGPWIADCLTSALGQSLTELEVVLVDDASDDDTVAVAESFAARDQRLRIHRNERRLGLARNWNRAVELARHAGVGRRRLGIDDASAFLPGFVFEGELIQELRVVDRNDKTEAWIWQ